MKLVYGLLQMFMVICAMFMVIVVMFMVIPSVGLIVVHASLMKGKNCSKSGSWEDSKIIMSSSERIYTV